MGRCALVNKMDLWTLVNSKICLRVVHWLVIAACNLRVEIGTGLDLIELSGAICWSVDVR